MSKIYFIKSRRYWFFSIMLSNSTTYLPNCRILHFCVRHMKNNMYFKVSPHNMLVPCFNSFQCNSSGATCHTEAQMNSVVKPLQIISTNYHTTTQLPFIVYTVELLLQCSNTVLNVIILC